MSTPDRDLDPADALRAEREAEADPVAAPDAPEVAIGFSPRQILGGFALLAAMVVWLFRRRKR